MRGAAHAVHDWLPGVAVLTATLGSWEAWARMRPSFLFPPFSTVATRAWEVWPTTTFLTHVTASLERLTAGYLAGAVLAIAVGVVSGSSHRVGRALEPTLEFLRAVPPVALVPAGIVVFGFGDAMRISVIAFGVFFPVFVNTIDGLRAVAPEARDTAAVLGLGRLERALRVDLMAALPSISAGLRVALSIGLIMVVISELVGGSDGIGHYILLNQRLFNAPEMYGGILFLGLLGLALNRLFLIAERSILGWHRGAIGENTV